MTQAKAKSRIERLQERFPFLTEEQASQMCVCFYVEGSNGPLDLRGEPLQEHIERRMSDVSEWKDEHMIRYVDLLSDAFKGSQTSD